MTVPTLHGESADAYAARVLTTWRDGYRDPHAAHRVVLVIVTEERRSALAMARGLDAALTDDQARRLLTRTVAPALVDSRPGPALVHAVAQILLALGAEPADVHVTTTDKALSILGGKKLLAQGQARPQGGAGKARFGAARRRRARGARRAGPARD